MISDVQVLASLLAFITSSGTDPTVGAALLVAYSLGYSSPIFAAGAVDCNPRPPHAYVCVCVCVCVCARARVAMPGLLHDKKKMIKV